MKLFSTMTLSMVAGLALSGASLIAGDRDWDRDQQYRDNRGYGYTRDDGREFRREARDLRYDYSVVHRLQERIAFDRARLDEDYRCHRPWPVVAADRRDLERDEFALDAMLRDIRHDQHELREGYRRW